MSKITAWELTNGSASEELSGAGWAEAYSQAPPRALELFPPADSAKAVQDEPESTPETETAAEAELKNGVYHEIKRKLVQRWGLPPDEIAFIHHADTPAKKAALFEAVNAGRVRVLIGSTGKLGTGVNVQRRLVALHHVDQPWKPAELEQREGRILRQGNIYPEVLVFHYVTERSFDGYMLQTLEAKARFISHILAGEVTARTAEDVGEMVLTVAQVKAIASGNPLVQKRIETEVKLVKLDRLRAAYYQQREALRAELAELPQRIAAQKAVLAGHERALVARKAGATDAFCMTLKQGLGHAPHVVFDKRERAGAQLLQLADLLTEQLRRSGQGGSFTEEVGTYRGFRVAVQVAGHGRFAGLSSLFDFKAEVQLYATPGEVRYVAQVGESKIGVTQALDYQLRHIEAQLEQTANKLRALESRLAKGHEEVKQTWQQATEYHRLRRAYEALGAALQAEGVAVEHSTDFAASAPEEVPEVVAETADAADPTTSADAGLARNPFTGLEDWPLLATEPVNVKMAEETAIISAMPPSSTSPALFQAAAGPLNPSASNTPPQAAPVAVTSPMLPDAPALPLLAQMNQPLLNPPACALTPRKKCASPHRKHRSEPNPAQGSFAWQD